MSNYAATPGSAVSDRVSPETKMTPFSVFIPRNSPKVSANTAAKMISPPPFVLRGITSKSGFASSGPIRDALNPQDPFVSSTTKAKLSPTANNFTPLGNVGGISASLDAFQDEGALTWNRGGGNPQVEANLHQSQPKSRMAFVAPEFVPTSIGHACMDSLSSNSFLVVDDDCTRYLMISNVFKSLSHGEIEAAFSCQGFSLPSFIVTVDLGRYGIIYASFNDIREASKASLKLGETQPSWTIHYIQLDQYMSKYSPNSQINLAEYKGEVHVLVTYYGSRQRYDAGGVTYMVKKFLRGEGELMSCDVMSSTYPYLSFFAKYFDVIAAKMAILRLNGSQFKSCSMMVSHIPLDISNVITTCTKHSGPLIIGPEKTSLEQSMTKLALTPMKQPAPKYLDLSTPPVPGLSPASSSTPDSQEVGDASPFGRTFRKGASQVFQTPQRSNPHYATGGSFGPTLYPTVTPRFASYEAKLTHLMQLPNHQAISPLTKLNLRQHSDCLSGHHNVVDIERIRLGLDVRTTIMLRNIPNKIDQAMLKEIVDETSFGKYDFMYLRIDFANNCNVGYAFINFEDPWQIIDFVNTRAGHRWNRFNSDKVAEVSYATIQGKDCLVQKFRNSSVMLEHPSFRPKIFHTNGSLLTGQEDSFPSPDNPSKMRRSVENAEHVGLFAPRAGQHFRNQQRRRRSQYDRGTRLAEFEDACEVEDFASSLFCGYAPRMMIANNNHDYVCDPMGTYGYAL